MIELSTQAGGNPPPFARTVRMLLYVLLLAAAALTFSGIPAVERAVREGRQPPTTLIIAPAIFALFIGAFAVYRFALVRARRYPAGRAFFQIGLMLLVLTLVLPGSLGRYHSATAVGPVQLNRWLSAPEPDARAMAAELARHRDRAEVEPLVPHLIELLDDPSSEVRRQALASLEAFAGGDKGGEGEGSAARWRAWWQAQKRP
jgi:hypothetical protein